MAWQIWTDTGGTFTDGLGLDPSGGLHRVKVLSSSALRATVAARPGSRRVLVEGLPAGLPDGFAVGCRLDVLGARGGVAVIGHRGAELELEDDVPGDLCPGAPCELRAPVEAPVLAAHLLTRTPLAAPLPPLSMRLATTRGTNALLERRGAATALFVTEGFGDLLEIGNQQRPDLFALDARRPPPLAERVVEVGERLAPDGSVVRPLELDRLREAARQLLGAGVRCAAVALLHAWRNPSHEDAVAAALAAEGFEHVARSAALAPLVKLLPRAETAVVEAYLAPVVGGYLERVASALPDRALHVMTSAGGLAPAAGFRAKDALLSGPAGGVVGAAHAGRRSGTGRVLSFDMGGTSTDVARWDGDLEYVFSHTVGGVTLMAPALAVETVAAGGGSVCRFDGQRLRVGPESAGAEPGPACYGAGGPLAVTDLNLVLGRVVPERFGIPLDPQAAVAALDALAEEVGRATGDAPQRERLAAGLLAIADETMAAAIRRISVRRGYDPREYALVAFGGAGPQHGCAVAELLRVTTVVVPPDASLLSARGLGEAVLERFAHRQVLEPLAAALPALAGRLAELAAEAGEAVAAEGVPAAEVVIRRRIGRLRLAGQETSLDIEVDDPARLEGAFAERYLAVYGYPPPQRPVELESLRVVASARPKEVGPAAPPAAGRPAAVSGRRRMWTGSGWRQVDLVERATLAPGDRVDGPALVVEDHSATVVAEGWRLTADAAGALLLRRLEGPDGD